MGSENSGVEMDIQRINKDVLKQKAIDKTRKALSKVKDVLVDRPKGMIQEMEGKKIVHHEARQEKKQERLSKKVEREERERKYQEEKSKFLKRIDLVKEWGEKKHKFLGYNPVDGEPSDYTETICGFDEKGIPYERAQTVVEGKVVKESYQTYVQNEKGKYRHISLESKQAPRNSETGYSSDGPHLIISVAQDRGISGFDSKTVEEGFTHEGYNGLDKDFYYVDVKATPGFEAIKSFKDKIDKACEG